MAQKCTFFRLQIVLNVKTLEVGDVQTDPLGGLYRKLIPVRVNAVGEPNYEIQWRADDCLKVGGSWKDAWRKLAEMKEIDGLNLTDPRIPILEEWRAVSGYEGIYEVSNLGRVRSLARIDGLNRKTSTRVLKIANHHSGYQQVGFSRNGKGKNYFVHRVVGIAFLGEPPTKEHQINHKNGVKSDNRLENLEWVTQSENGKHRYRELGQKPTRPYGEQCGKAKLTDQEVRDIRMAFASGVKQCVLGRKYGVYGATIHKIVTRQRWAHIPDESEPVAPVEYA